jgi:hypothetical protein
MSLVCCQRITLPLHYLSRLCKLLTLLSRDCEGALMGLRPTKADKDAQVIVEPGLPPGVPERTELWMIPTASSTER